MNPVPCSPGTINFLRARFSGRDLIEIRAIGGSQVRCFRVRLAEYATAEKVFHSLNGAGFGIFAGVNPRSRSESGESAVRRVAAFHCESRRNSSPGKQSFGQILRPAPLPTLVVDTGERLNFYWQLVEPVAVTTASRSQLKAINRGLAMALGEDPTSGDLGRVLRLPGFINHLETPAEVKVLEELNIRYRPEEFQTFAITTREARGLSTRAAHVPSLSAELWARFNQLRDADESGELTKAWTGEWGDGSSDSLYFLVYKLTAARFTPKEVFAIACSKRWYDRKERRATTPAEILREVATALSNLAYLRRR